MLTLENQELLGTYIYSVYLIMTQTVSVVSGATVACSVPFPTPAEMLFHVVNVYSVEAGGFGEVPMLM